MNRRMLVVATLLAIPAALVIAAFFAAPRLDHGLQIPVTSFRPLLMVAAGVVGVAYDIRAWSS